MSEETKTDGPPAPRGGGKTVDLPVFGRTKRVYLYGAAAVVAVIVGYAYWRRAQGAAEDPSYYADLRTGSATGSDAYEGADDSKTGSSGSAAYDALPKVPTTDQEWTEQVVSKLTFLEPGYLYGVIGKYLARQGLSLDEAATIRAAWAAIGKPPGNQPIMLATDGSTSGTSKAPGTPTGLTLGTVTAKSVTFSWAPVAGASSYVVSRSDGKTAVAWKPNFHTATLKPNTAYSFTVTARNVYGSSAKSAALAVKTPGTGYTPGNPPRPATPYHTVRADPSKPGFRTILEIGKALKVTTSSIMADPRNKHLIGKKSLVKGDIVYVPVKK